MKFKENDQIMNCYLTVVEEAKKKPSAGLTKKQKSAVAKKARAGKDIGKKGKGFEKVAKAAGGGEKGKKIAAAAMWKSVHRESAEIYGTMLSESEGISIPGYRRNPTYCIVNDKGEYYSHGSTWTNPIWSSDKNKAVSYLVPDGKTSETARKIGGKVMTEESIQSDEELNEHADLIFNTILEDLTAELGEELALETIDRMTAEEISEMFDRDYTIVNEGIGRPVKVIVSAPAGEHEKLDLKLNSETGNYETHYKNLWIEVQGSNLKINITEPRDPRVGSGQRIGIPLEYNEETGNYETHYRDLWIEVQYAHNE